MAGAPVIRICYADTMTKTLERAIAEVTALSDTDQEEIGQRLLSHIEKLHRLRSELDKGLASLDAGDGKAPDVDALLAQARDRNGRA